MTVVIRLFSWLVLKAPWGLSAGQRKGKSFPTEVHFQLAYSPCLSLGAWLPMYLILNISRPILSCTIQAKETLFSFFLGSSKMLEQTCRVYAFVWSGKCIIWRGSRTSCRENSRNQRSRLLIKKGLWGLLCCNAMCKIKWKCWKWS